MQKSKFVFCVVLVLLLLGTSIWALGRNIPSHSKRSRIGQKSNPMENFLSSQEEKNTPLTPELWLSQHAQKIGRTAVGTGVIGGCVTQASGGAGIENVSVNADQLDCPYYGSGSAYTDVDGYYVIDNLPDGKYEVYTSNDSDFVDIYWNDKPLWGEPDTVTVVASETTPDIDFSIRVGGKITGRVTIPWTDDHFIAVYAEDTLSIAEYSGEVVILSDSNSASYEIRQLPTGVYKIYTYTGDSLVDEYYNDKPDWASANPVLVTEGSTTSGIDFTLALGGKITGTVTLPGASSVFASVDALNTSTGDTHTGYAINLSGSSAGYEITGLRTGTYKVSTSNSQGYLDEYYNDRPDETSADLVPVTQGSTTPNINFTLTLGGIVKGTITSSAKGPLKDINVSAFSTTNQIFAQGSSSSDASGNYRLTGLKTGYYKILAEGDSVYAWEYYNGKPSWGSADSVLVTAADSVTGKNFTLDIGGMITGYVYGPGALPISGAFVLASGTSLQSLVSRLDFTVADGSYKLGGLRTGYYWVLAYILCDEMWYDNKTFFEIPDSVYVTMPDTTSGKNFNFPSAVGGEETQIPSRPVEFELDQNYPNPFNPTTVIAYTLQKKAMVNLEIYNLLGQKVKTLLSEYQSPGSHRIFWDGMNDQDKTVASGIYFYRLVVDGVSQAKKMVLMK
ncbi:MAG TPA: carboxypeptidase regulatory-like domain-containing protein [candidate division Zixibacteria bacterium]